MPEKSMVLIVDDDKIQRLLLKQLFNNSGIEACCAENGEEALKEIAKHSFSCMITDFNMPRMNGIELARKAKSLAPRMPIALCTGDDLHRIDWDSIETGIEAVFTKPFIYNDLLAMVTRKVQKLNRDLLEEGSAELTMEPSDIRRWMPV